MTVHPEIATLLATLPTPDHSAPPDPTTMRAAEAQQTPPLEERLPLHDVTDTTAATSTGEVPIRIYTPTEANSHDLLVYFHGGAFFSGSLDTHDHVARRLAKETGHKIISVGYRLAPEAAYPAGLNDCYGVLRWAAEHDDDLNWNGGNLAIVGDSSGGNFVASVAAMAHDDGFDRITHQILYYPSVDLDFNVDRHASLRDNAEGYGLETAGLLPFNSHYINSGANPSDPLVSPIKREDLTELPPALIITAEYDPLRDEGELHGQRLKDAGVNATVSRYEGANHGFIQHFSRIPDYYQAFTETSTFLNRH